MLGRIVYVSRAAPGLAMQDVYEIIRAAHARHGAEGLGGALIFLDGCFAQVLEGAPRRLDDAFARIRRDTRHDAVTLRARAPALCRLFPGELMALRAGACIDPRLISEFGYAPGFPVESFPADALVEFIARACTGHRDRQAWRA